MDKMHAAAVLAGELETYRAKTYAQLRELVGSLDVYEVANPGGQAYQVEIQVVWDSEPEGAIRILGGIDDGGLSAFAPVTDDLLIAPTGTAEGC
jgi:hypothetical protein